MIRFPATLGKRDASEPAIIKALEAVGATAWKLPTGQGLPDLLVGVTRCDKFGVTRHNFLIEVKTEHGKLNIAQRKWHRDWAGHVDVARTPAEALAIIGLIAENDPDRLRSMGAI